MSTMENGVVKKNATLKRRVRKKKRREKRNETREKPTGVPPPPPGDAQVTITGTLLFTLHSSFFSYLHYSVLSTISYSGSEASGLTADRRRHGL